MRSKTGCIISIGCMAEKTLQLKQQYNNNNIVTRKDLLTTNNQEVATLKTSTTDSNQVGGRWTHPSPSLHTSTCNQTTDDYQRVLNSTLGTTDCLLVAL